MSVPDGRADNQHVVIAGRAGRWLRRVAPARATVRTDLVAGLSGAISGVPDGMAASVLAGVNPVYGLYASLFGPIGGGLTASTRLMVITTTSAAAVAAGSALAGVPAADRPRALFLLTLLAGALMVLAGLAKLGRYIRFVPHSVMIGFLSGVAVDAIVHTHTHIDHVGATAEVQLWSGAPARIHEADRFLYQMLPVQAAFLGVRAPERCELTGDLDDAVTVRAGAAELVVMHTPGHTPGSVCFVMRGKDGGVAFTGDTLFQRGIGRTDLWGGDSGLILRSLRQRILTLEDDTRVIAGHGPSTTIGDERRHNPFLRGG